MKLHKGDQVLIISGKDKGKKGKILEVFPKDNRVLVEGANLRKKHQKPRKQGEKGSIIVRPAPIQVSNLMAICSKCGKSARTGYKITEGKKYRVCKKCGQEF